MRWPLSPAREAKSELPPVIRVCNGDMRGRCTGFIVGMQTTSLNKNEMSPQQGTVSINATAKNTTRAKKKPLWKRWRISPAGN